MPAAPKPGPALFLGLELATDQLRASIVDESLELVGVECVDFDTELPEYQCVCYRASVIAVVSSKLSLILQDSRRDIHDTGRCIYNSSRHVG